MVWEPNIEYKYGKEHFDYLRETYLHAEDFSDDLVTKTGAILVDPDLDEIIAHGANHLPPGMIPDDELLLDRTWKYTHMIHAEPAAVHSAARAGKRTDGSWMYMPWVPCTPCAKVIIDAGISTLIGHEEMIMKTPERWWKDTDYALDLLDECGVERYMVSGKINDCMNLFDGEYWRP